MVGVDGWVVRCLCDFPVTILKRPKRFLWKENLQLRIVKQGTLNFNAKHFACLVINDIFGKKN